ncbi:MAG: hypothetical protein WBB29_00295 [Geitlerinemataceae cyanobacterium]
MIPTRDFFGAVDISKFLNVLGNACIGKEIQNLLRGCPGEKHIKFERSPIDPSLLCLTYGCPLTPELLDSSVRLYRSILAQTPPVVSLSHSPDLSVVSPCQSCSDRCGGTIEIDK